MGQKSNPNILRLGKIKDWNSKYLEKKTTESSVIIFKNLEIKKFISQIFSMNDLYVQDCKVYYSESSLRIYVCYYNSVKPSLLNHKKKIKLQNKQIYSRSFKKKTTKIKRATLNKQIYLAKKYQKTFNARLQDNLYQNQYLLNRKTQRSKNIQDFLIYTNGREQKILKTQTFHLFTSKVLKSLNLFTENKQNIFLNLKQINNETNFLQKITKTNKSKISETLVKLRKFQQNEFFEQGCTMLYNFMLENQNPQFLAEFIAFYLRALKRPNFFLRFLKVSLKTLATKRFSKFERIQIKIRGRFNGAPRSSHKFINIGKNIPALTLNSKVSYGESTAYTSNGTFGVKVWAYTSI